MSTAAGNSKLETALTYAERGWPVLPLQPNSKIPLKNSRGFKDATIDRDQIKRWWTEDPARNIGIACGGTGPVVLDIDEKNDVSGMETLMSLDATCSTSLISRTPHGYHLFFEPDESIGCPTGIAPGIDVRGAGSYIVAPGSVIDGVPYQWDGTGPGTPIKFPDKIRPLLKRAPSKNGSSRIAEKILEGQRNQSLTSLAGSMRRRNMSENAVSAALQEENRARCVPPLPDSEIDTIVASVWRYPAPDYSASPIQVNPCRKSFAPTPGDVFAKEKPPERNWVWKGFIPEGGLVGIAAPAKVGKTTLVSAMASQVVKGRPFLGQPTTKTPILILALEEHADDVRARMFELGLNQPDVFVHAAPLKSTLDVLADMKDFILKNSIGLVIVDTLIRFWDVQNENDASQVAQAIAPILNLARETNAAIFLIHHSTKVPSDEGRDIRGSGDLLAAFDVGITMRRRGDDNRTHRIIKTYSRYKESPSDVVIALENGSYELLGATSEVKLVDEKKKILEALTGEFKTSNAIADEIEIPGGTVRTVLDRLAKDGKVQKTGKGVKNDPFLYRSFLSA